MQYNDPDKHAACQKCHPESSEGSTALYDELSKLPTNEIKRNENYSSPLLNAVSKTATCLLMILISLSLLREYL